MEKRDMSFTEICIYQVKPQKVEEFEALMIEVKSFLEKQEGLLLLRFIKRGYRIDMEQIKEGLPPIKINRIVKSVKYMRSGACSLPLTGSSRTASMTGSTDSLPATAPRWTCMCGASSPGCSQRGCGSTQDLGKVTAHMQEGSHGLPYGHGA